MTRILVVEDSRTQAAEIRFLLEDAGYVVDGAGNGLEALAALGRQAPDLVLTDLQMPEMDGLQLVEAIVRDHAGIPVVLMTALGSEEIAVRSLRAGAASYVPKRNLVRDIVPTIQNILDVKAANAHEDRLTDCLSRNTFEFRLENDPALIPPLINFLQSNLVKLRIGTETSRIRVGVALREAVVNAMDHGNLELSSDLRQEDDESQYFAAREERRVRPPYSERALHIKASVDRDEAVYVIRDEGLGYDPGSLPDPFDPTNLERIGGRGLLLIRTFMDDVSFNDKGTEVTMRKYWN